MASSCLLVLLAGLALSTSSVSGMEGWMPPASHCESVHDEPSQPPPEGYEPEWPTLPKQYSLRVEANIFQKQYTSEVEEHYDYDNQRASASYTSNGTTVWSFFDYKVGERYDVYPNGTCDTARAGFNLFGYSRRNKQGGRPVMATIGEVFNFGKKFNMTYVGRATARGIKVDHWTSCKDYGQYGSKFQLDWYFTTPDYQTASGHSQIPVRLMLNGHARNGTHRFEHMYEFVSIRTGPVVNEDVFQIPPGVVCKTSRATRQPPPMPDRFQMSMEVVVPNSPMHPRQQCLRYDYEHRLMETSARMTVPVGWKMGKMEVTDAKTGEEALQELTVVSMSTVEDHKNGVVYHMDKVNLTCKVSKLDSYADRLSMSHGTNILFMDTEDAKNSGGLQFQGHTTVRGMNVEVWSMEKDGVSQQVYFLPARESMEKRRERMMQHMMGQSSQPAEAGQPVHDHQSSGENTQPMNQQWASGGGGGGSGTESGQGGPPTGQWGGQGSGQWGGQGSSPNRQWGSAHSGPRRPTKPMTNMNMFPYPMIVGMYLKNRTHNAGPMNMMRLFRDVMTRETMQWANEAETTAEWDPNNPMQAFQQGRKMKEMISAMSSSEQVAWGRRMERVMDSHVGDKQIHVFDYHPLHLDSTNFQVSFCYEDNQKSQVLMLVMAPFDQDVLHHYGAFSNGLRNAIASATGLSVLQISDLVPLPIRNKQLNLDATKVTFNLLGKPPGEGINQVAIEEAKEKLSDAVNQGITFNVEYTDHSKSFIVDKGMFATDFDKYRMADLMKRAKPVSGQAAWKALKTEDGGNGDDGDGYSASTMAAVSITTLLLGAAICFGVIYFFYKKKNPNQSFAPYKMTTESEG